ncbi:hypothetical protein C8Q80DRAFT_1175071 [Daedaleopsis nitida]|nr:hypothetical protein C8Q80DRAFT_1175071 [Daedaleopsis nitida]
MTSFCPSTQEQQPSTRCFCTEHCQSSVGGHNSPPRNARDTSIFSRTINITNLISSLQICSANVDYCACLAAGQRMIFTRDSWTTLEALSGFIHIVKSIEFLHRRHVSPMVLKPPR